MRHDVVAEGYGLRLRPISVEDAGFVVELRTDPARSAFIHATDPGVEAQQRWLEAYLDRPGDYYWIIERTSADRLEGTVGLYDLDPAVGTAEWGRWVLRAGSPGAAGSALLLYEVAFGELAIDRLRCRTVAANTTAVSFHDTCRLERTAVLPGAFERNGQRFDVIEHTARAGDFPGIRAALEPVAIAAATLMAR